MQVKCPHCGEDIDLVGMQDMKGFALTPNMVQHAQARGRFPIPWLKFNNRAIWLRRDIEHFVSERGRVRAEQAVKTLSETLSGLSENERREVLDLIQGTLPEDRPRKGRTKAHQSQ